MPVTKGKCKCLTLEERVECLKQLESGKSSRNVAALLGVGRSQVQNVLKRKREIVDEYESSGNLSLKRRKRETKFGDLNRLMHDWYIDASSRRIKITGPLLQDKAKAYAAELGLNDFKASNGWLESFQKRHNLVFKKQSGDNGDVSDDVKTQNDLFDCDDTNIVKIEETPLNCDNWMKDCNSNTNVILRDIKKEQDDERDMANVILRDIKKEPGGECDVREEASSKPPEIVTYEQAAECIEILLQFSISRNLPDMLELVMKIKEAFVQRRVNTNSRQPTITDFFKK